jgi:hypothetical protein
MKYYYNGKRWNVDWVEYGPFDLEVFLERDDGERVELNELPRFEQEELLEFVSAERAISKHYGGSDEDFE